MQEDNLKYNYHDSQLDNFEIGPRRELNLTIFLDPIWNKNVDGNICLGFRGIENLEQVEIFFEKNFKNRRTKDGFLDEIKEIKKIDKKTYHLKFENAGRIEIQCKGHTELH